MRPVGGGVPEAGDAASVMGYSGPCRCSEKRHLREPERRYQHRLPGRYPARVLGLTKILNFASSTLTDKNAYIFCIGRELLAGLALDRNANFLAGRLSELGFRVRTIQVLDDVEDEMVAAFRQALSQKAAVVITTGGMGPGHDDITRECMAKASGRRLVTDAHAVEMLKIAYRRLCAKGVVEEPDLNETRLRMAQVPEGSVCYENPIGTAPAVQLKIDGTVIFMLPGTSEEMQRMFTLYAGPELQKSAPSLQRRTRTVTYPFRDESALSKLLGELQKRFPGVGAQAQAQGSEEHLNIRITLYGEDADLKTLEHRLDRAEADLRSRLGLDAGR